MRIIGHKKQIGYLNGILENKEEISHAFLFSGPDKIGKKTIALEFIKSIQCEKSVKIGEFCGKCSGCEQIGRVSADFLLVEPEKSEDGGIALEIGISAIRNLKNFMSTRSASNYFKIAIIDDAHLMTIEAQNALLKILEEPAGDKMFFLISSSPGNLLFTILSRLYQIKFNLAAKEDIKEIIDMGSRRSLSVFLADENNKNGGMSDKDGIYSMLRIIDFRPGIIFDCLTDKNILEKYNKIVSDFFKFAASDTEERFKYIEKISKDKNLNLPILLEKWIMILRLALFQKAGIYDLMEGSRMENNLNDFGANRKIRIVADSLCLAQELYFLSKSTNINQRLALEMLALKL